MANEAKTKISKLSFKPVGAMMKDWKESWDTKVLNRESKLVPGGEWVEVETGGDDDMMVCVTPEMKKKLPKGEDGAALFILAAYGDLMWDQDKKDFVTVVTNNAGEEKAIWLQKGKGVEEVEQFMNESKTKKSKVPVLESFSSIIKSTMIMEAEAEDSDGNILQNGDLVDVDAAYGGGRGTVIDTSHGSFVIVEIGGKNVSYHASNLTLVEEDDEEEEEDFEGQYEYVIDLDERGDFRAHVEDQYGNSVFEIDGMDDLMSLIEDGFMKDKGDTDGLLDHLVDLEILPKDAILESAGETNETATKLVKGEDLTPEQRKQVLAAFVYRNTKENEQNARRILKDKAEGMSFNQTDDEWIKTHAFRIKGDGTLGRGYAEPVYMAEAFREGSASNFDSKLKAWASKYGVEYDMKFKDKGNKKNIPYFALKLSFEQYDALPTEAKTELNGLLKAFGVDFSYRNKMWTPIIEGLNEAMETVDIHISDIKPGDTIVHNGEVKTVTQKDIKNDKFMGTTIFGDSYKLGNKKVQKVTKLNEDGGSMSIEFEGSENFKDTNGKTPKVGDFIANENGEIGKVKSFSKDKDGGRMKVDFRGHYLELNPKSTFEIINPNDRIKKAFESRVTDKAKKQKDKSTNAHKDGLKGLKKEVDSHYKEKGTQPTDNITAMGKDQIGKDMEKHQKRQPKPEYKKPKVAKDKKK